MPVPYCDPVHPDRRADSLVNRGWVSESYREQDKREFTLVEGEVTLAAILRFPGKRGYFVPENEPENGFWFTVPEQIVNHLGFRESGDSYLRGRAAHVRYHRALLRHAPKPTFATRILDMPSPAWHRPR